MKTMFFFFIVPIFFLSLNLYSQEIDSIMIVSPKSKIPIVNNKIKKIGVHINHDNISSSSLNKSVNKKYGFTKSGLFYINKSIIKQFGGESPCFVSAITYWRKDVKMKEDGNYYIYQAKTNNYQYIRKLEYCFYVGDGNYIPELLLKNSSALVSKADVKLNNNGNGHNFYTFPQEYYPGKNK